MRIGITGHQRLGEPAKWHWVKSELDRLLTSSRAPLIGITSLAIGADQLFAERVLAIGGELVAIIPFEGYERTFAEDVERATYFGLLDRATKVETLPKATDDQDAFLKAGQRVIELSDEVFAVWNGYPSRGRGGTGDAVLYAIKIGRQVVHINPVTHETRKLNQ